MEVRGVTRYATLDHVNDKVTLYGFSALELVGIIMIFLVMSLVLFYISLIVLVIFVLLYVFLFKKAADYFKECARRGVDSPLEHALSSISEEKGFYCHDVDVIELLRYEKTEE
jgi:hypothetical protein